MLSFGQNHLLHQRTETDIIVLYMKQSKLPIQHIETFIAVVQAGSFTQAAARLHQPKSRVSRHIAQLEKDLGVQLIYRTTRQFQLTEAGRRLFESSKTHLDGLEAALSEAIEGQGEISGLLRLTAPEDFSLEVLTGLTNKFLRQYPKVRLEMVITNAVVDLMAEKMDVALRVGQPRDSTFLTRSAGKLEQVLVASPKFLQLQKRRISPEDLAEIPCLSFFLSQNHWILKAPKGGKKKIKINAVIKCTNHFALRSLALQGQGIALLPSFLVRESLLSGDLVQVLPHWSSAPVPVQVLMPPQKSVPLRVRRFVEFLVEEVRAVLAP